MLALGTAKGDIVLHDMVTFTSKKDSMIHVHSKCIRRIAWIDDKRLLTTSDDITAAVIDYKGETPGSSWAWALLNYIAYERKQRDSMNSVISDFTCLSKHSR